MKYYLLLVCFITYLKQTASLSLVSIGFLQLVVHFPILHFIKSCNSSKHSRDIRKYLKNLSSCDSSSIHKQGYSPNFSLFLLISCTQHRLFLFLLCNANSRRRTSSSELIMNIETHYYFSRGKQPDWTAHTKIAQIGRAHV